MSDQTPTTKPKGFPIVVLLCIVLVAAIVFGIITYLNKKRIVH